MKTANFHGAKNDRRIRAINRLEKQLVIGRKTFATKQEAHQPLIDYKDNGIIASSVLTEDDVKRIKKEIVILQSKIVSPQVAVTTRTKKYRGA